MFTASCGNLRLTLCASTYELQVLELVDPLEDQVGYVYDKKAILAAVDRGRGQPIPCPVQGGSPHTRPQPAWLMRAKPSC
jgi:hypothetical protein